MGRLLIMSGQLIARLSGMLFAVIILLPVLNTSLTAQPGQVNLRGEWIVAEMYLNGVKQSAAVSKTMSIVIGDSTLRFEYGKGRGPVPYQFKVNTKVTPNEIDLIFEDSVVKGIIRESGSELFLAIQNKGEGRPADFTPRDKDNAMRLRLSRKKS